MSRPYVVPLVAMLALLVPCRHATADEAVVATVSPGAFAGTWRFDAARSGAASVASIPPSTARPPAADGAEGRDAGAHSAGGMGGGGGMGGHGGGGGGRHHHDRGGDAIAGIAHGDDATQNDRGLERIYADHLAISALARPARIRFDDGTTPVDLGLDGMNVSGPGVGGTLALSSTSPDLVIDSVTDSGYTLSERYHLIDDGRHLELHIRLKKPGTAGAVDTTRVFDRADPVASPTG